MKRCAEFPNKRRYSTKEDAETVIIIMASEHDIEFRTYYCEACKGWHLASVPDKFLKIKSS
jgi:hypothetical protein